VVAVPRLRDAYRRRETRIFLFPSRLDAQNLSIPLQCQIRLNKPCHKPIEGVSRDT
jgi:hypothetical protein